MINGLLAPALSPLFATLKAAVGVPSLGVLKECILLAHLIPALGSKANTPVLAATTTKRPLTTVI